MKVQNFERSAKKEIGSLYGATLTTLQSLLIDETYAGRPAGMKLPFPVSAFSIKTDEIIGLKSVFVKSAAGVEEEMAELLLNSGEKMLVPLGNVFGADQKQVEIIKKRVMQGQDANGELFKSPILGLEVANAANRSQRSKLIALVEECKLNIEGLDEAIKANDALAAKYRAYE